MNKQTTLLGLAVAIMVAGGMTLAYAEPLVKDDTIVRAEPVSMAKDATSPTKKDADTEVVTATGTGTTTEKATKNALRAAVDMVVSSLIDAKTKVENCTYPHLLDSQTSPLRCALRLLLPSRLARYQLS